MKTEDLIDLLARQPERVPAYAAAGRLATGTLAGVTVATALMIALLGVNSSLREFAAMPPFWLKLAFAFVLAVAASLVALRLSRPGASLGALPAALAAPVGVMWVLAASSLARVPPDERSALIYGGTWVECPLNIALLALPVFAGVAWAMKGLAPTRLRLAGAAAGLTAGAAGALVYALHCPELAVPFVGIWYVLGMLIPTALGALIGPRLLRW
jgi:hypothetical protein